MCKLSKIIDTKQYTSNTSSTVHYLQAIMNDRWMNTGYEDNEKLRPAQDQPQQAFDQDRIGLF